MVCWLLLGVRASAIEIGSTPTDPTQQITVAADWCCRWQQGVYEVYHLRGNCYVNQGLTYARAPEAVLWVDRSGAPQKPTKVIAYLESDNKRPAVVYYQQGGAGTAEGKSIGREEAPTWFERFYTSAPLRLKLPESAPEPAERPAIYERGLQQFDPRRRQQLLLAQYTEFAPPPTNVQPLPPGMRSFQWSGRSDIPPDVLSRSLPDGGQVTVITGGFRVLIEGLPAANLPPALGPLGTVDISTDRAVVWSAGGPAIFGRSSLQSQDTPLEIYMEGNIEFRPGTAQ